MKETILERKACWWFKHSAYDLWNYKKYQNYLETGVFEKKRIQIITKDNRNLFGNVYEDYGSMKLYSYSFSPTVQDFNELDILLNQENLKIEDIESWHQIII